MNNTAKALPWQEPPVFPLPGTSAPDISSPPRAYAVQIHGIDGIPHSDLPSPAVFDENQRTKFTYDVSRAVGASASEETIYHLALEFLGFMLDKVALSEGSSITYFAYDIGGMVVKQALLIASSDNQYEGVLDRSSLIIFYGTPHQPSAPNWAASTLRLLNFRFVGLLGPWVPTYVEAMSVYQQRLNDRFRVIASDLRVLNICQATDSPDHDVLTDAACATVGLEAEEMILLDRSHNQLHEASGHEQLRYLRETILDAETRLWQPFRNFVSTVRISQQEPSSPAMVGRQPAESLPFAEESLQKWQEAQSAAVRLILASPKEFESFCDSFSWHIKRKEGLNGNLILRLGRSHPYQFLATCHQLYASLIVQFLEQKPSLLLLIRHLYPNLRDAILGDDSKWKTRSLARCLRTLLLAPKRGVTYCLIEHAPGGALLDIIAEILATTRQSENSFRLLLATSPDTVTGLEELDTSPIVNPHSRGSTIHIRGKTVLNARGLITDHSMGQLPPRTVETHNDNAGDKVATGDAEGTAGGAPSHAGPTYSSPVDGSLGSLKQTLSRFVDENMLEALHGLAWICFAIRPLSRIEAEQALSVVWASGHSYVPSAAHEGGVILKMLELALPNSLSTTRNGVILASPELRQALVTVWTKHIGDNSATPGLYLARTLFSIAVQWLRVHHLPVATKSPMSETTTPHKPEDQTDAAQNAEDRTGAADKPEDEAPVTDEPGNEPEAPDNYENVTTSLSSSTYAVGQYAARCWIEHYLEAVHTADSAEDSFRRWLGTDPGFEPDIWIKYLSSENWSPAIEQDQRLRILPSFLQETFRLGFMDACYISFKLATLPLGPDDDSDWRLLEIASNRLNEEAYLEMVLTCREKLTDTLRRACILQRAVAAATDELREKCLANLDSLHNDDFIRTNFVEIFLTAIAIGNTGAVTSLFGMTATYTFGRKQENLDVSSLGTALQVACEYGDEALVKKILGHDSKLKALELEKAYPWNALHVACHQAQALLVTALVDSGGFTHDGQTLATDSPWKSNPLLITSNMGLFSISKSLKPLQLEAPADEEGSVTPLQLASSYGFEKTVVSLIEDHGQKPSLKHHDSHPVFQALCSGRDKVARRVYVEFIDTFIDALNALDARSNHSDGDGSDSDGDNASEADRRDTDSSGTERPDSNSLFASAEDIIVKALFTALQGNQMMSSIEAILDNLQDSSKLRNSMKRSPVMVAALMGSVELVEKLYTESTDNSLADDQEWTLLHCACAQGHMAVVRFLIAREELTGLTVQNTWSETPLIAAAVRGHRRIVKLLLSHRFDVDLQTEFTLAVEKGLDDTADLILKAMDPTARRNAINAKQDDGTTSLHVAARQGSARMIQLLLLRGADAEAVCEDRYWPSPLAIVTLRHYDRPWPATDSIRLLLDAGASPDSSVGLDDSVLLRNVYFERVPAVRLLLEYGAVPRVSDYWSDYTNILAFAVKFSSVDVVKVLLRHFEKLRKRAGPKGPLPEHVLTPAQALETILGEARPEVLEAYINVGGSLDMVTSHGYKEIGSAFMYAAAYGSYEMLQAVWKLPNHPVDVNETGGYHGTALQAALVSGTDALAKTKSLLAWGATTTVQEVSSDDAGRAALHGYWGTPLHAAVRATDRSIHEQMLPSLLEMNVASKSQPDAAGRLPLHLAATLVYPDGDTDSWVLAEQLSDEISTIASEDYQGRNALHMACGVGNLSFVQELLRDDDLAEQVINKKDDDGWTPLHWACRSKKSDLVELLIQHGAATTSRSIRPVDWLPYHVAVYHGWAAEAPDRLKVDDDSGGQLQPTEPGQRMGGICDCCRCRLYGVRHACTSKEPICGNFDLCFKCIMHQSDIHPADHKFEKAGPY